MALYAFDGTWNREHSAGEYGKNTNVVKFHQAFKGQKEFYTKGVGTKLGLLGKIVGGAFGVGGKERIREASLALARNVAAGDRDIDIIGFSRGAALALHFAHTIETNGIRDPRTGRKTADAPAIRFLGLWDVVAAFGVPVNLLGIPFQRINLGYHLSLSPIVQHCFHAVSLDERRPAFRETRVKNGYEVWFRGVHSDVGGGNDNIGLSDIALRWMLRKALLVGLPIDTQAVAALDASARPETPISDNKDPFEASFRTIPAGARMHYTVSARAHCSNPPDGCGTETAEDESNRVGT